MRAALDPAVAAKLAKVCGLLGSDHDGERAAAAAAGTRLLRALGLTWGDLFEPSPAPMAVARQASALPPHMALARAALERSALLDEWQRDFLASIAQQWRPLSPKQRASLERILHQVRGNNAGTAA